MSSNAKSATTSINASAAGQFTIGDITINRLGYGAMRITGKGVWGPPKDRSAALAPLRRLPEVGVSFIDTADSYGQVAHLEENVAAAGLSLSSKEIGELDAAT